MRLLSERAVLREIRAAIKHHRAGKFAVAFWGDGAAERLGIDHSPETMEVVCNLRLGGTNPREIARMSAMGVLLRHSNTLHSKVYLFPDRVIIGSSNASSNGLSFQEGEIGGWQEANVLSSNPKLLEQVSNWWSNLTAAPVDDSAIDEAREAWSRRRSSISLKAPSRSLLKEMQRSRSFFDGKQVYLVVYSTEMDDEGIRGLEAAQEEYGSTLGAFQGWSELPTDCHLVCFWRGPRGGLVPDGIWQRRRNPPDRQLENSTLQLCWEEPSVFGLGVPPTDLPGWRAIVDRLRESDDWDAEEGSGIADLAEVSRRYL